MHNMNWYEGNIELNKTSKFKKQNKIHFNMAVKLSIQVFLFFST